MSKIWEEYKHIKCGDFLKWWSDKTAKEKLEWGKRKEQLDAELENHLWDRESRRKF